VPKYKKPKPKKKPKTMMAGAPGRGGAAARGPKGPHYAGGSPQCKVPIGSKRA
jgi:hypothetical protein